MDFGEVMNLTSLDLECLLTEDFDRLFFEDFDNLRLEREFESLDLRPWFDFGE
jgi:hypothetical protein